jgi:hypothetical protein
VFFVTGGKLSSCLSDMCLVTVGANDFVYSGLEVFVMGTDSVGEKFG